MASKEVIDTHTLLWYLVADPRLGSAAKSILDDPNSELVFPIIALSEAVFIVESGRKSALSNVNELMNQVHADKRIAIYPLTWPVFQESLTLTAIPEIHDRLIIATALYLMGQGHTVSILTKDSILTRLSPVPIVW